MIPFGIYGVLHGAVLVPSDIFCPEYNMDFLVLLLFLVCCSMVLHMFVTMLLSFVDFVIPYLTLFSIFVSSRIVLGCGPFLVSLLFIKYFVDGVGALYLYISVPWLYFLSLTVGICYPCHSVNNCWTL